MNSRWIHLLARRALQIVLIGILGISLTQNWTPSSKSPSPSHTPVSIEEKSARIIQPSEVAPATAAPEPSTSSTGAAFLHSLLNILLAFAILYCFLLPLAGWKKRTPHSKVLRGLEIPVLSAPLFWWALLLLGLLAALWTFPLLWDSWILAHTDFWMERWLLSLWFRLPLALLLALEALALLASHWAHTLNQMGNDDATRMPRALGLSENEIFFGHTLTKAFSHLIHPLPWIFATMWGSLIFLEPLFAHPGIAELSWQALQRGDYTTLVTISWITAVMVTSFVLLRDVLTLRFTPREQPHFAALP